MDSPFVYRHSDPAMPGEGPLKGLRVAIQPNISHAGWPADAGSRALDGFCALEDATVSARLRQQGATVVGSTSMSEFGLGLPGGGLAQVIKTGEADAQLVLDLAGECRIGAATEGLCGFKPSYGLVPRTGLIGLIPSMEVLGVIARDTKILRRTLEAMAGPDGFDFSMSHRDTPVSFDTKPIDAAQVTLGVIAEASDALTAPERAAFDAGLQQLKAAGFTVRTLSWPHYALCAPVHRIVGSVEASSATGRYDSVRYGKRTPGAKNWNEMYLQTRGAAFGPLLKSYLFTGAYFQFECFDAYEDACRIRAGLLADVASLIQPVDFLVFPAPASGAKPADDLDGLYDGFVHTTWANVTGWPALCLTLDNGSQLQIATTRFGDARLLALGDDLQNRCGKGQ